jgi:hypothetical protein
MHPCRLATGTQAIAAHQLLPCCLLIAPPCRLGAPCLCRSRSTRRACFGRLSSARQSCSSLVSALATCKRQRHTAPCTGCRTLSVVEHHSQPSHAPLHCCPCNQRWIALFCRVQQQHAHPVVHPIVHPKTPSLTRPSHTRPTPAVPHLLPGLVTQGTSFPKVGGSGLNLKTVRIPGILQRIAWAYFVVALIALSVVPHLLQRWGGVSA